MTRTLDLLGLLVLAGALALGSCAGQDSSGTPASADTAAVLGTVEFGLVVEQDPAPGVATGDYPHWDAGGEWAVPHEPIWTLEQPLLSCRVAEALRSIDALGFPAADVTLVPADGEVFAEFTERIVGRRLAVLVDGKVVLAPTVSQPLTGRFELSGRFSEEDVSRLLERLRSPGR